MNNSFQLDGEILFINKTINASKTGKEFFVRNFALNKPEFAGGQSFENQIKMQLKGTNCEKADKMLYNGEFYHLMPGDLVVVDFGLNGSCSPNKEMVAQAAEKPSEWIGNPKGLDGFSPNVNAWNIIFAPGYVPNPANKVGANPVPVTANATVSNIPTPPESVDDLPF